MKNKINPFAAVCTTSPLYDEYPMTIFLGSRSWPTKWFDFCSCAKQEIWIDHCTRWVVWFSRFFIWHVTDPRTDRCVHPQNLQLLLFQIRTSLWLQFKIQTSKEEEISFQIRDRQTRTFKGPWYNFVSPCNPIFIHSLFNLDSSLILFKCMSRLRSRLSDPWWSVDEMTCPEDWPSK